MPASSPWDASWDTSTRAGSVAAAAQDQAEAFAELDLHGTRAHASDLLPSLGQLCDELNFDPRRPARVFVGIGPGSYTGLRVGLATALGFARGAGAQACGLCSYDAIAFGALAVGQQGVFLGDARRGTAYMGHYERTADGVEALAPLQLVQVSALVDDLPPNAQVFAEPDLIECETAQPLPTPRAGDLIRLGRNRLADGKLDTTAVLEPLYLRAWGE